jgi:hypothetical protein
MNVPAGGGPGRGAAAAQSHAGAVAANIPAEGRNT